MTWKNFVKKNEVNKTKFFYLPDNFVKKNFVLFYFVYWWDKKLRFFLLRFFVRSFLNINKLRFFKRSLVLVLYEPKKRDFLYGLLGFLRSPPVLVFFYLHTLIRGTRGIMGVIGMKGIRGRGISVSGVLWVSWVS